MQKAIKLRGKMGHFLIKKLLFWEAGHPKVQFA
jgi:hypothetical protein